MRKVQILFPNPQLRRLREAAKREDRPFKDSRELAYRDRTRRP